MSGGKLTADRGWGKIEGEWRSAVMEHMRRMKLWYYLAQGASWVTSGELARYAQVSERTVKNDLAVIRSMAEDYGCLLHAQKGKGYRLEVVAQEQFQELEDRLHYQFSGSNYTQEYEDRANRVLRILLAQPGYLKLDEVADRLYLSRSSLKNLMPDVRRTLELFRLRLESRPGSGVRVEGEEINRRFCMLELFLDHDYRSVPNIQEEDYMEFFRLEQGDIGRMRHRFLKVLRESGIRVVDNNTHRLVRYFFLLYNRWQRGFCLEFSAGDRETLREFREYGTAGDILQALEEETGIAVDETEQFGLELLLLLWSDLNEEDDLEGRYPALYRIGEELAGEVFAGIRKQWGVDLEAVENGKPLLISALISGCVKLRFPFLGYDHTMGKKVENNMMSSSPVSMALAISTARILKEKYGLRASQSELFHYGERFYIAVSRISYHYRPRRLLISAQSGNQSCSIIRDKLVDRFGEEAFERLDMVNGYEIRGLDQSRYDYMIFNFAPYYYRYDLPVIYVDCIPDARQLNQVYHQVILGGYGLRELQASLGFDGDFLFEQVPYEGRESLIRLLAYKHCGSRDVQAMENDLMEYTDICVWNGMAVLVTDTRLTGKNSFQLFCLDTPGVWEKKTVKYVLFVAVNFQGNRQSLKYLEQLTHELSANPDSLETLISTGSLNQCSELVKHGL